MEHHALHVVVDGTLKAVTSPKDFDSVAFLSAVASFVVALATAWLGLSTRNLARETVASMALADRHHQESNAPLLVIRGPRVNPEIGSSRIGDGPRYQRMALKGTVINIGAAPALEPKIEVTFGKHPSYEPVRFSASDPEDETNLQSSLFYVTLPDETSLIQSQKLHDDFEYDAWTITLSYLTPFGAERKTIYKHDVGALEYTEHIEPVPVARRNLS
jgi:hypothetical protein